MDGTQKCKYSSLMLIVLWTTLVLSVLCLDEENLYDYDELYDSAKNELQSSKPHSYNTRADLDLHSDAVLNPTEETSEIANGEKGSSIVSEEVVKRKDEEKHGAKKVGKEKYHAGVRNKIVNVKPDIITSEIYPTLVKEPYSVVNNFWNDGLEERFQSALKTAQPLKVLVIPFSHNDAGWLKTFEEYYNENSRQILNSLARELLLYKDMTFVWTEICFLERWWKRASLQDRESFLDLVRNNRIEICPGGWVMPDEACPHLFALIVQMTEGHMWVKDNLGVLPKVGWSIDPFGHSSTMAFLLHEAGLTTGTVIQRVHYGWKAYLARKQAGDFIWKQEWDVDNRYGLLTHHLPFNIYSTSVSCGPHAEVCEQFDFNLTSAAPITFRNVKMKTEELLSEYWRTGSLFPHSVVMAPLGDDFRFSDSKEFAAQYKNYKAIMDYSSSDKRLRACMMFGTPSDYFKSITKRHCKFPVLEGDFLPYADYDCCGPAYWTGYYSTRPHHKKLSRVAEWNLRSAEILFTFALNIARQKRMEYENLRRLYNNLISSRRNISLFQHHDGITGTSKARVMEDFRNKLIDANTNSVMVQGGAIQYILGTAEKDSVDYSPSNLAPLSIYVKENDLPLSTWLKVIPGQIHRLIIFNSLGLRRQELLRFIVSNPCVEIKDTSNGKLVGFQVNPVWYVPENALYQPSHHSRVFVKKTEYELVMVVDMEPLSLKIYEVSDYGLDKCCFIRRLLKEAQNENAADGEGATIPENFKRPHHFASVYSLTPANVKTYGIFTSKVVQLDWFALENSELIVKIDRNMNFIYQISRKDTNETFSMELNYHAYEGVKGRSGAYLFKPANQTSPNCTDIDFMVIHGPIVSESILIFHGIAQHTTRVFHFAGPLSEAVQVENILDLNNAELDIENIEVFMKLKTEMKNGKQPVFYSDSNGFQMHRRQRVCDAGIETNYYPSTTCVYIEDEKTRLSILTEQSHGVSSNYEGQIEVMLDRRSYEDDKRGMGEGVLDTRRAIYSYFLLFEQIKISGEKPSRPSLLAHTLIDMQTYPINAFLWKPAVCPLQCPPKYSALFSKPLPCDMRIVNLRTYSHPNTENYPLNSALMTLHRRGFIKETANSKSLKQTCSLGPKLNASSGFLMGMRFKDIDVSKIQYVSLTGLHEYEEIPCLDRFSIDSFAIKSIRIDF